MFCQIIPDSEDEYELPREFTDVSKLSDDLAYEYPTTNRPEYYSYTWNHFIFNNM